MVWVRNRLFADAHTHTDTHTVILTSVDGMALTEAVESLISELLNFADESPGAGDEAKMLEDTLSVADELSPFDLSESLLGVSDFLADMRGRITRMEALHSKMAQLLPALPQAPLHSEANTDEGNACMCHVPPQLR